MTQYTTFLSPLAEAKLTLLLQYIELEFGIISRDKFFDKFKENVYTIEKFPFSCLETEIAGIYKSVVSKQTSFYFRIRAPKIEILTISDNRQDPKSVFKELKNYP
ncbi:MAG: type II toxin-antitoxin system RelE/ParE family toxin [Crocinitomicaceae bacterium]